MLNRHGRMMDFDEIMLGVVNWTIYYPVVLAVFAALVSFEAFLIYRAVRWLISCL